MSKVRPELLRGFDEYLPHEQLQFNSLVAIVRRNFERYGFMPIETPAAERKEILTSKGGVEKEIYALSRLAAAPDDDAGTKGALHFDLTVPLARYVAMRERELPFPFRRYQIQKVWRGETPQTRKGRYREFYQCDIDIINRERLSYLAEAEIPSVIYSVFREMRVGRFTIRINNRKVLRGLLHGFEVADASAPVVLRALDKLEKEERGAVLHELREAGLSADAATQLYDFVARRRGTDETLADLAGLAKASPVLQEGASELRRIVDAIRQFGVAEDAFAVDLRVVRGLDYYTGTIYETSLDEYPEVGSVCSGGRYDDLASYFTATRLPGVGISIGLTRLFAKLKEAGLLQPPSHTPAEVLVATMDERHLERYLAIARSLREAGVNTEVYLEQAKLDKQLQYASRKGFRIALIAGESEFGNNTVKLKNLATRTEVAVSAEQFISEAKAILGTKDE